MRIKYFCEECQVEELFDESQIAYKYQLNVGGKHTVWHYVCNGCDALKNKNE